MNYEYDWDNAINDLVLFDVNNNINNYTNVIPPTLNFTQKYMLICFILFNSLYYKSEFFKFPFNLSLIYKNINFNNICPTSNSTSNPTLKFHISKLCFKT